MKLKEKSLAINSILIVISTTIIGTMLHELAHFLTANFYGLNPELHHNYVKYVTENATEIQKTIIAGIGPLFSLLTGILFLVISIKIIKPSLSKLFSLWLGMNGILMFLGYILIAPIAKNGDTGKVFDYLKLPTYISVVFAIASLILIIKLFKKLSGEFKYYKNQETFEQTENAKQLFLYPILSSILFMTILSLPVMTWISLLPTIFMPMAYFSVMKTYQKMEINIKQIEVNYVSKMLIFLTFMTIVIFRILI